MAGAGGTEPGRNGHRTPADGRPLSDDEVVLAAGRPSRSNWPKSWILCAFFALMGATSLAGGGVGGSIGSFLVAAGFVGYVALARRRSRYVVTDRRVSKDVGLLGRSSREVRLRDVTGATAARTRFQALFGTGTVRLEHGPFGATFSINGVGDPGRVADSIREQLGADGSVVG